MSLWPKATCRHCGGVWTLNARPHQVPAPGSYVCPICRRCDTYTQVTQSLGAV